MKATKEPKMIMGCDLSNLTKEAHQAIIMICNERKCSPAEALEYVMNEINKSRGEAA